MPKMPQQAEAERDPFYPESMKNVRSYSGFRQKSVVFSN